RGATRNLVVRREHTPQKKLRKSQPCYRQDTEGQYLFRLGYFPRKALGGSGAPWGAMEAFKESKMRKTFLLSAVLAPIVAGVCFGGVPAQAHGDRVSVKDGYTAGTILIRTGERRLYYFTGSGEAIRYPVGVGRAGMQWSGTAFIDGKYI